MRLKDKVAIVTGAAWGMGASTAELFAAEGACVMVTDILDAEGTDVVARINDSGAQARFLTLDVTNDTGWASVVGETISTFGQIDILVNNAGVSGSHPDLLNTQTWDEQMDVNARGVFLGMQAVIPQMQKAGHSHPDLLNTQTWDEQMDVNARGVFLGMQAVIPQMQKAGAGSIVNISSISGIVGQSFVHMGYNAAKGAVRMASKAAAVQFAPDGIRVNSVHPGLMPAMRTSKMTADPKVREKMLSAVPFGRVGRVEEVAYANLFLASDESSYITGIELPVDGGFLAM